MVGQSPRFITSIVFPLFKTWKKHMCVCVSRSVVSNSATLWSVAGSSVRGILQARILEWEETYTTGQKTKCKLRTSLTLCR